MDNYKFSGVRKTYVCFSISCSICGRDHIETKTEEVKSRDLEKLKIPENTYKFYFFDRIEGTVKIKGKESILKSDELNLSKIHYYGVKAYTRKEIENSEMKRKEYILKNMDPSPNSKIAFCGHDGWIWENLDKDEDKYVFLEKPEKTKKVS